MKLYFCLLLPLFLSLCFCSTLVSTADTEIFVNSDATLYSALLLINDNSHTTITLTDNIFYNSEISLSGKFTLRSSPGQKFTLTSPESATITLERDSNPNTNQIFQDLIFSRPFTSSIFMTFHSTTQLPVSTFVVSFINISFNLHTSENLIKFWGTYAYFKNCVFNYIASDGTILLIDSPTTFLGCEFNNNVQPITLQRAVVDYQVTIDNCTFNGNTATYSLGGAISSGDVALKILNSKFYDNSADTGGAIYFSVSSLQQQSALEIISCEFDGNSATFVSKKKENKRAYMYVYVSSS